MQRCVFACAFVVGVAHSGPDRQVEDHYRSFETQTFANTSYSQLRRLLLRGVPFVVSDGARGLPMESWSCIKVQQTFSKSRLRQEGGTSGENSIPMSSDWPTSVLQFEGAQEFPKGAPKNRPFYWDIAKGLYHERDRDWGAEPDRVVQQLIQNSAVPYWLPKQDARKMGKSSEMWFHPKGAGAPAHMDPHCQTTVSFCFSGVRKWRMMLPPARPHPEGYFDGQVYDTGEWQPTFELTAPAGSAIVVYPGMIHETLSVGEECSSSISQTFEVPIAAAYFRAFWPRFALLQEDERLLGAGEGFGCRNLVEDMVVLGSGAHVAPGGLGVTTKAAEAFIASGDTNRDGTFSEDEIQQINRINTRTVDELIAFHDVNQDGIVSTKEVTASWVMYATSIHELMKITKTTPPRPKHEIVRQSGDEGHNEEGQQRQTAAASVAISLEANTQHHLNLQRDHL